MTEKSVLSRGGAACAAATVMFLAPFVNAQQIPAAPELCSEWFFRYDNTLKPEDAKQISLTGKIPEGSLPFQLEGPVRYYNLEKLQKKYTPIRDAGLVCGTIIAQEAGTCTIGLACDWWFTCYVNGEMVGTTEPDGNDDANITPYHHRFTIPLKPGKNYVAIHTRPGAASWGFCFALLPDTRHWPEDKEIRKLLFREMFPVSRDEEQEIGGPIVSKVTYHSAVITLAFKLPEAARLRFWEECTDKTQAKEIIFRNAGLMDARNYHLYELTGLKESTSYAYETDYIRESTGKWTPCGSGIFTTLSSQTKQHSFAVFGDTQVFDYVRLQFLKDCCKHHLLDGAFYSSLGDMDSLFDDFFHSYFSTALNVLTYPNQKNMFVPVRGNHEFCGTENGKYAEAFGCPYYSFCIGDTIYIVLDTVDTEPRSETPYSSTLRNDTAYYIREQAEWFKKLTETSEFREAKHRIVLAHASPFTDYLAEEIRSIVGPWFYGENAPYKLDLWICGHEHVPMYSDPETKMMYRLDDHSSWKLTGKNAEIPFPVFVNDGTSLKIEHLAVSRVDVFPDCLELRMYRHDGSCANAFRFRGKKVEVLKP